MNQIPFCTACKYSGIEPGNMDLACMHPELRKEHVFGLTVRYADRREFPACGPEGKMFEQHPGRTPEGQLRSMLPVDLR